MSTETSACIVKGTVHHIGPKQQVTEKLAKKLVVVDNGNQYQQYVPVEFVNQNIDATDGLREGQEVEITVALGGRHWAEKDRYYASINGTSVSIIHAEGVKLPPVPETIGADSEPDDLPF